MRFHRAGLATLALLVAAQGIGCHIIGSIGDHNDGPHRWSDDWYAQKAQEPEGARQVCCHGKQWPPYARPNCGHQEFTHRFHAAHYWPWPYNCQDRAYLRTLSATQVASGWQKETTLYGYHFDEKDNTLNHAGILHLKWILQTIPEQRRLVFVQASDDKGLSDARLAAVRSAAVEMVGEAALPPIMLRADTTDGRPTDEVNAMRKKEKAATRVPQIPYSSPGTSAAGVTGGSSSGSGNGP